MIFHSRLEVLVVLYYLNLERYNEFQRIAEW